MQSNTNSAETTEDKIPITNTAKSPRVKPWLYWLLVLILFATSLFGVYTWQNGRVKNLSSQLAAQQQEIQALKAKKDAAESDSVTNSKFPCGEPKFSEGGGPLPDHERTNQINWVTGSWIPMHIDIKLGTTVTWSVTDYGDVDSEKIAIKNDAASCEQFSSQDFKTGATSFKHTFNKVGVFGWHDKYDGSDSGHTITVSE